VPPHGRYLLANIFLYSFEAEFIQKPIKNKIIAEMKALNSIFIDDGEA
jgi:hypothetical protein